jgi:phage shock protein E
MIAKLKHLLGIAPSPDFAELIAKGAIILDVRTKGEFSEGHVKGSINMPLDQVSSNLKKLKNKEQPIITCCASGMRSASARSILKGAGYLHVYNAGPWSRLTKYIKS